MALSHSPHQQANVEASADLEGGAEDGVPEAGLAGSEAGVAGPKAGVADSEAGQAGLAEAGLAGSEAGLANSDAGEAGDLADSEAGLAGDLANSEAGQAGDSEAGLAGDLANSEAGDLADSESGVAGGLADCEAGQSDSGGGRAQSCSHSTPDFFMTPTSSPRLTPPLSPHLHSYLARPLPSFPAPARIGDRVAAKNADIGRRHETFFSSLPAKFADIKLLEGNGIPSEPFLQCCRAVLPFFGELLHFILMPFTSADLHSQTS